MADTISAETGISETYQGTTISPGDADYDAARAIYNGSIDRRPALVARPRGAADVIDIIGYARDAGLPLSVRCGGHGVAGTSLVDGGVVIDLSSMKGVQVDVDRGTGDHTGRRPVGRVRPGGRAPRPGHPRRAVTTTGVGGFCLGGGYGGSAAPTD